VGEVSIEYVAPHAGRGLKRMKIFNKYWFSTSSGAIGIVTGEDQYTKIKKAYIKVVAGLDENYDAKDVMENGSPVPDRIITDILRDLK